MALVRLDKWIAQTLIVSRKDASGMIRAGRVTVNGQKSVPDAKVDPETDTVTADGTPIGYAKHLYFMLNKPAGLVCANEDKRDGTVLSLFPKEYRDKGLSTVGRLDKDTVGLLLVTNDGALSHKLLSPKSHAEKTYFVRADKPFAPEDIETMRRGIVIDGKNTAPARLELCESDAFCAYVTLTEGKFHEVKRLCYACGEKEVLYLRRDRFAGLVLDETLACGAWRALTEPEIALLRTGSAEKDKITENL